MYGLGNEVKIINEMLKISNEIGADQSKIFERDFTLKSETFGKEIWEKSPENFSDVFMKMIDLDYLLRQEKIKEMREKIWGKF